MPTARRSGSSAVGKVAKCPLRLCVRQRATLDFRPLQPPGCPKYAKPLGFSGTGERRNGAQVRETISPNAMKMGAVQVCETIRPDRGRGAGADAGRTDRGRRTGAVPAGRGAVANGARCVRRPGIAPVRVHRFTFETR